MSEEILPFDFGWRIKIYVVNAIPTQTQFFVRKPHDDGCRSKTIDLLAENRRLRSIVEELVVIRNARLESEAELRASSAQELRSNIEYVLIHRFISLIGPDYDAHFDEALQILMATLDPHLEAAQKLELSRQSALFN